MQTFLPSTDFEQAAKWLDNRRLGKQRVECLQILKALTDPNYGWQNHPAVNMWRGYKASLVRYGLLVCKQWMSRGYKDTCYPKIVNLFNSIVPFQENPPWLTEEFASNHRSILLGKAFEDRKLAWDAYYNNEEIANFRLSRKHDKACDIWMWYNSFGWTEQPAARVDNKWPYLWPEVV